VRPVWPPLELPRPAQPAAHAQDDDELGRRVDKLSERLDDAEGKLLSTEGKLRGVATYAAVVTAILVVGGVAVYVSTARTAPERACSTALGKFRAVGIDNPPHNAGRASVPAQRTAREVLELAPLQVSGTGRWPGCQFMPK
jgi:hypothetical protein